MTGEIKRCYRCANVWRSRRKEVAMCPLCKSKLWDVARTPIVTPFDPENSAWMKIVVPNRRTILSTARRHHGGSVRVFGSVRRGTATPESDLDLLVRFDRNASLLNHISLKLELEEKLKRKVDVIGDESIFWLIRPQVLAEAIPL